VVAVMGGWIQKCQAKDDRPRLFKNCGPRACDDQATHMRISTIFETLISSSFACRAPRLLPT
jgi:hypothetical protein